MNRVFVDRSRLKQVLYNYLSNAIKFTPERGRVDGARHRTRMTSISASTSPIPASASAAADLPRLFIEFNQLEAGAAKKHQGTGLGLALTRRLVEAQGGRVGGHAARPGRQHVLGHPAAAAPRTARRWPIRAAFLRKRIGAPSVLVIEDEAADQTRDRQGVGRSRIQRRDGEYPRARRSTS